MTKSLKSNQGELSLPQNLSRDPVYERAEEHQK